MDPLLVFLGTIVFVSFIIPRLGPFLSLVISAILYGLFVGMGAELMGYVVSGLGRIFSSLVIVVFAGAVIAEYLRKTGAIDRIVADLLLVTRKGLLVSGLAGYLISLPVMCSITAYMILEPVVSGLGMQTAGSSRRFLFMTAACSVISFNLIYPSPFMASLTGSLNVKPYDLLTLCIPISLLLFVLAYFYMLHLPSEGRRPAERPVINISRFRAWFPLILPMGLILLGGIWEKAEFIGNTSVSLLVGALLCLVLAREKMQEIIHTASRRSGVIMLDLCGAGAFGYVVAQSGLGREIYSLGQMLPVLALPFIVSAVLQLAQGSRVVTAIVASQILSSYPLDGIIMAMLIGSGAFMFSYFSDPYFWLIKESTGASMKEMVKGYTLPLSILGLAALGATVAYSLFRG
jgi:GntP family gluconate:H+ symporter